jgi:nucleoid-associated protein YgaU
MAKRRSFSRYENTTSRWEDVRGGGKRKVMAQPAARKTETAQVHMVIQGDRLDLLAFRYYGDPTKWWIIADANRSLFPATALPFELLEGDQVGEEITIPYNPIRS